MKKFELTSPQKINRFGHTLYRIKACISFTTISGDKVNAGDLGGWIEKEQNLSHDGKAWIWDNAEVWGNAEVHDNVQLWENAEVCDNAQLWGNVQLCGNAKVCDKAQLWDNAEVWGNAEVCDNAQLWDNAKVWDNAKLWGNAKVCGNAEVWGNAEVCDDAQLWGNVEVWGNAKVWDNAKVCGDAEVCGDANIFSTEHVFSVTPISVYANSLTIFRTKKCELKISFELDIYTIPEFFDLMNDWDDKHRAIATDVINIARNHINLSPASSDDLKPCPFCGGDAEYNTDSDVVVCTKCGTTAPKEEVWNNRVDG